MSSGDDREAEAGRGRAALVSFRAHLFAIAWAVTALFHLAGNPRPAFIATTPAFTTVNLLMVGAAGAVLIGRARRAWLVVLCVLIVISAWLEAPVVGNHWVLAAAISATYLVGEAVAGRRAAGRGGAVWQTFAPAARLSVLIAYGFAAFAKLNAGFFDPATSCAVFYSDQLVRSWGLGALSPAGRPGLGVALAIGAAATELSVVALLLFRRTRRWGLLVALPFHWLLALDWSQHFWDFSSVLFAAFLLFADDALIDDLRQRLLGLSGAVRPSVQRVLAVFAGIAFFAIAAAAAVPASPALRGIAVLGSHATWAVLGTAVVALVGLSVLRVPALFGPASLQPPRVALLVPLLVLVNGLTPYLEIKTGFGWNMYSNLRTVDGQTNHFLVPATLDLTNLQADRVEVLATSDPELAALVNSDHEIVYSEFREYAHAHPQESVTYRRGGRVIEADPVGRDAAGEGEISVISYKLQSFRSVDASGAQRCQAVFTAAR